MLVPYRLWDGALRTVDLVRDSIGVGGNVGSYV